MSWLFPLVFLIFLGVSNALWASTVGISVYINQYYNVSPNSLQAHAVNAIWYLIYVVVAPFCVYLNYMTSFIIALLATLAGLLLRLFPSSSIYMLIASNIIMGISQPLIFSYITKVAGVYVNPKNRGSFIGASTMFSTFGYAVGYVSSIYLIQSLAQFEQIFGKMTGVYLAIHLLLILGTIIFLVLQHREKVLLQQQSVNMEMIIVVSTVSSLHSNASSTTMDRNNLKLLWTSIILYSILTCVVNVFNTYLNNMLLLKNISENDIFIISSLNFFCGIPFPIFFGKFLDKTHRWIETVVVTTILLGVTFIVFIYSTNVYVLYIDMIVNAIVTSSISSVFLTLASELCYPAPDQNYNNLIYSLGIFLSFIVLLIPLNYSIFYQYATYIFIASPILFILIFYKWSAHFLRQF